MDPRRQATHLASALEGVANVVHIPRSCRSAEVLGYPCPSLARNIGAQLSQEGYICFCDDDDFFEPDKILQQVVCALLHNVHFGCTEAYLYSSTDTNTACFSAARPQWHYNGVYWKPLVGIFNKSQKQALLRSMFKNEVNIWTDRQCLSIHNCVCCSSVIVSKELFMQAGMFPTRPFAEDWCLWQNIHRLSPCLYIRTPLVHINRSPSRNSQFE